jgi:hypothetical protein
MPSRRWEEYQGWHSRKPSVPRATITRYPRLTLNQAAYKLLGSPTQVLLLYDARHQLIGLRAAAQADPHSYCVRKQTRGGTNYIVTGSQAFIRHYRIDYRRLIVFSQVLIEDGVMVLDLDQARRVGRPLSHLDVAGKSVLDSGAGSGK